MELRTDALGIGCGICDHEICERNYIRLYKPHPKDWYGETKMYLYRVRDGWRKVGLLRRKCRKLDIGEGEEEFLCADELHKKLEMAEQDMKVITAEVMDLISTLPDADQQTVMVRRYLYNETWKQISAQMNIPVSDVLEYHQTALPILKRALKNQSVRNGRK